MNIDFKDSFLKDLERESEKIKELTFGVLSLQSSPQNQDIDDVQSSKSDQSDRETLIDIINSKKPGMPIFNKSIPSVIPKKRSTDIKKVDDATKPVLSASPGNLQLVNGKIVMINNATNAVNRIDEQTNQPEEVIVTNSASFKPKPDNKKWSEKETKKFYKCLKYFGTDFSLFQVHFKNRNFRQIKNKFAKEEKINLKKIDTALAHHSQGSRGKKEKYKVMINKIEETNQDDNKDKLDEITYGQLSLGKSGSSYDSTDDQIFKDIELIVLQAKKAKLEEDNKEKLKKLFEL